MTIHKARELSVPRIITTVSINEDDYKFIKQKGYKTSNILRKAIKDLRTKQDINIALAIEKRLKVQEKMREDYENYLQETGGMFGFAQWKKNKIAKSKQEKQMEIEREKEADNILGVKKDGNNMEMDKP